MSSQDYTKLKYKSTLSTNSKLQRVLWEITYRLFFRPTPRWTCHRWRIWLLRLFGTKAGTGCIVSPTCKIWAPWNLELGSYSCLGDDVDCYCVDKIIIGSKVAISQRAFLCTASHEIKTLHRELRHKPIQIDDHAWVCAESYIAPGTHIGEGAVVGARSVVVSNVDDWNVVAGNPAKMIKKRKLQENK